MLQLSESWSYFPNNPSLSYFTAHGVLCTAESALNKSLYCVAACEIRVLKVRVMTNIYSAMQMYSYPLSFGTFCYIPAVKRIIF